MVSLSPVRCGLPPPAAGWALRPTVGEVEHLTAAALCQQVVDGKAAGLAIGDELDGLCAMLLQVAQGVQVAGKGGRVVGTGVGAQGAVLAHRKADSCLSVHHPQLKGAVGVGGQGFGGTAVGAGVGAVAVVLPVVAKSGDGYFPSAATAVSGCTVFMFVIALVLHPAIFRAGGILAADLFFGANIFAMDDLLLPAVTVVPQLCIIANGVYKAACSG